MYIDGRLLLLVALADGEIQVSHGSFYIFKQKLKLLMVIDNKERREMKNEQRTLKIAKCLSAV